MYSTILTGRYLPVAERASKSCIAGLKSFVIAMPILRDS